MGRLSKDQIRNVLSTFLSREDPFSKVDACGRLSNVASMELQDQGLQSKRIDSTFHFNGKKADHSFVILPASDISDASDGPVIVDPSIEQFGNETNTEINIRSITELDSIGIFEPEDSLYNHYKF